MAWFTRMSVGKAVGDAMVLARAGALCLVEDSSNGLLATCRAPVDRGARPAPCGDAD
jgi:hypothetical protein